MHILYPSYARYYACKSNAKLGSVEYTEFLARNLVKFRERGFKIMAEVRVKVRYRVKVRIRFRVEVWVKVGVKFEEK